MAPTVTASPSCRQAFDPETSQGPKSSGMVVEFLALQQEVLCQPLRAWRCWCFGMVGAKWIQMGENGLIRSCLVPFQGGDVGGGGPYVYFIVEQKVYGFSHTHLFLL